MKETDKTRLNKALNLHSQGKVIPKELKEYLISLKLDYLFKDEDNKDE